MLFSNLAVFPHSPKKLAKIRFVDTIEICFANSDIGLIIRNIAES